jgi:hypothetical protein
MAKSLGPSETAIDLDIAVSALVEAIGCDRSIAIDIVDSIARFTVRKAQGCLPAGWGRRGR